jgi:ElaB/YqjD/DUF883 family membrane-anchored ribosome-binding protein
MADLSRSDIPNEFTTDPGETQLPEPAAAGAEVALPGTPGDHRLPEAASPAINPRLNRSAAAIGHGVGTAVAGMRNLPRQLDEARARLFLVGGRAQKNARALGSDLVDGAAHRAQWFRESAVETASELRGAAATRLHEFGDAATSRASELAAMANELWLRFQKVTARNLDDAQWRARRRTSDLVSRVRQFAEDEPARFLMRTAGVAFVLGIALRIWRSNRD